MHVELDVANTDLVQHRLRPVEPAELVLREPFQPRLERGVLELVVRVAEHMRAAAALAVRRLVLLKRLHPQRHRARERLARADRALDHLHRRPRPHEPAQFVAVGLEDLHVGASSRLRRARRGGFGTISEISRCTRTTGRMITSAGPCGSSGGRSQSQSRSWMTSAVKPASASSPRPEAARPSHAAAAPECPQAAHDPSASAEPAAHPAPDPQARASGPPSPHHQLRSNKQRKRKPPQTDRQRRPVHCRQKRKHQRQAEQHKSNHGVFLTAVSQKKIPHQPTNGRKEKSRGKGR
jgi:hypothetical protein